MFRVTCDECDLDERIERREVAYALARDHEAAHPTHHVSCLRGGGA